jgi:hypothetical protein
LKWKLISYTEIFIPLLPNKGGSYVIGIAENVQGERILVHIDERDVKNLTVDCFGKVTREEFGNQKFDVFRPRTSYVGSSEST